VAAADLLRRFSQHRLLALLAAIASALALVAIFWPRHRRAPNKLLLSGTIEAHQSVLGFKVPGRIATLPVEEGQEVQAGALLATLDNDDYRQQVALDAAVLRTREAELALALAGTRNQELRAAAQAVVDAEADLSLKRAEYERARQLLSDRAITRETYDVNEAALKRAQAVWQRARQSYSEAREGVRKEQIDISRAGVGQAREALRMSQIRLSYTELRAPTAGVVLVRDAELGEVVAPGTPVMTVADVDHVWMRAYVNEPDLPRVRWGQAATVRTDARPGKSYVGRISFISSEAEFTPKSVETHKERVTLVYRTKIDLDNPAHELKPGMPVDAVVDIRGR
jgi:HlyD family secretion protein